jgi:hypothetical protein
VNFVSNDVFDLPGYYPWPLAPAPTGIKTPYRKLVASTIRALTNLVRIVNSLNRCEFENGMKYGLGYKLAYGGSPVCSKVRTGRARYGDVLLEDRASFKGRHFSNGVPTLLVAAAEIDLP